MDTGEMPAAYGVDSPYPESSISIGVEPCLLMYNPQALRDVCQICYMPNTK